VRLGAACLGEGEACADLDPLHRLDPHHRGGQPCVEPVLLRRVRAEAGWDAARPHLHDTPDGVAIRPRRVDAFLEARAHDRAVDLDADLREQLLRDRSRGDVDSRLAGTRALERVPGVGEAVLERPGEVGVARPRHRDRLRALSGRLALRRPGAHPPRPVLVVAVANEQGERRAERPPVPQAGEHLDAVFLDPLARAATIALLAAAEIRVDGVAVES
jgi:hypothetical protein